VLEGPADDPLVRYVVRATDGGVWVRNEVTLA
jgi:hypothetical protein